MHYLSSIDRCSHTELENELKYFFHRLHHIKQRLKKENSAIGYNRTQRHRCQQNLLNFEVLERDFCHLSYQDDLYHLYRKVHHYVKLDQEQLLHTFSRQMITPTSLFIAL